MQKRRLRIWQQACVRVVRFYSLSLIFSLSASPSRRKSERFGMDGSRGRAKRGIDYYIGRELAPRLAALGLTQISGNAETAIYNGGLRWADYWTQTIAELRGDLITSGKLNDALVDTFLDHCADSRWWTETIAFSAVHGRAPDG